MATVKAPAGCFWEGGILYGRTRINGVLYRKSLETDNSKLAESRRDAWAKKLIADLKYGDGVHSFEDVLKEWNAFAIEEVGESTHDRYKVSLGQLSPWLSNGDRSKNQSDIDIRLVALMVRERRKQGVTNATIKRDLTALSSVLGFAKAQGWRLDNPALDHISTFSEKRNPITLPLHDDIETVKARARFADRRPGGKPPGMWAELIHAAVITGARLTALTRLDRRDIDLKNKTITLHKGKGNKTRKIDIEPFGGVEFFANLPEPPTGHLAFWHDDGEPYRNPSSNFANNIMLPALKWAQENGVALRRFKFHDLRHRHAVDWLEDGRDIYDLQKRMAHANVSTTELYLDYVTTDVERSARFGARKAARK